MIYYNPKSWFTLIFKLHKTDTFRQLYPVMIAIALYTSGFVVIEEYIFDSVHTSTLQVHSLLGFVISLLLVFRTNTAYDRWWEGRKLWGSLLNNSRNLALKFSSMAAHKEAKESKKALKKWIAAYAYALKEHLRGKHAAEICSHAKDIDISELKDSWHLPNRIAANINEEIQNAYSKGIIDGSQLLVLREELTAFTDICGGCERIRKTPIPYTYSLFIKKFIFMYTVTMPIAFVGDFGWWTLPIVVFVFYALASLEVIAEEIEDPFGTDANDLPTDEISQNIAASVHELLA